ncbi:MAG: MarR family winged helix-turn-helix transcriptional regulator [Bacilli bacterium]
MSTELHSSFAFLVQIAHKSIVGAMEQKFSETNIDVTYEQYFVLSALSCTNGMCQLDLAKKTGRDQASMSRLVITLLRKKYIEKIPSPTDKRYNLISLTTLGEEVLQQATTLADETISNALNSFKEDEIQDIELFLKEFVKNLGVSDLFSKCPLLEDE